MQILHSLVSVHEPMRDYVVVAFVFSFDTNPMPPPDKVMIAAGCYYGWDTGSAPAGTAGNEVYPIWLRLNKGNLISLMNAMIAMSPDAFYSILQLQLGDETGLFWTRSPRPAGINSITEERDE